MRNLVDVGTRRHRISEWGLESLGPRPPGLVAIAFITSIPRCGSIRYVVIVSGLSPRFYVRRRLRREFVVARPTIDYDNVPSPTS